MGKVKGEYDFSHEMKVKSRFRLTREKLAKKIIEQRVRGVRYWIGTNLDLQSPIKNFSE